MIQNSTKLNTLTTVFFSSFQKFLKLKIHFFIQRKTEIMQSATENQYHKMTMIGILTVLNKNNNIIDNIEKTLRVKHPNIHHL